MDEWDRYIEDQKYARSLRWNAEAGHVRGLVFLTLVVVLPLIATIAIGLMLFR